jgi:hypothetical protein
MQDNLFEKKLVGYAMELVALNFDTKINDRLRSNTKVFWIVRKEIALVLLKLLIMQIAVLQLMITKTEE